MTTSLVTGGAGFLGSHVAAELLRMGHKVLVVDDLSGGFRDQVPEGAEFCQWTVTDPDFVDGMFGAGPIDYVFHLAAYAAEGLSHFIRRHNYENNVIGSVNLINAAIRHKVKRFVFTSSIAVYGDQGHVDEHSQLRPIDPYGIAKYAVEQDLRCAHDVFGLEHTLFRPHNVYGEHQNLGDRYRNVVGIFMNQIMQGRPMTVFGDGEQTRAFSYVADVAPVIARSIDNHRAANKAYNVGASTAYSVNELAAAVAGAFGVEPQVEFLAERHEARHLAASHRLARRDLDVPEPTTLDEGLARMAAWAQQVGARQTQAFPNIELTEKLPPSWSE